MNNMYKSICNDTDVSESVILINILFAEVQYDYMISYRMTFLLLFGTFSVPFSLALYKHKLLSFRHVIDMKNKILDNWIWNTISTYLF